LFYADSPHRWKYSDEEGYLHQRHYYSDTTLFFITADREPLIIDEDNAVFTENYITDYGDWLEIHENETDNILKSGREWYEPVSANVPVDFNSLLQNTGLEPGEQIKYSIKVLARSSVMTPFRLESNSTAILSIMVPEINIFNTAGTFARSIDLTGEFNPMDVGLDLKLRFYNNGNNSAKGWLDYLTLHYRKKLEYQGVPFPVTDHKGVGAGNITRFNLISDNDDLIIWDVTNSMSPFSVPSESRAGGISFIARTDSLREFWVFRLADAIKPLQISDRINNQNLHYPTGYDMIIITHEIFRNYAEKLAQIHIENDQLISKVVTPEEIYNEFSGGINDISAIRNYVRMVYNRNKEGERPLKYLLLFGDGSYENKIQPPDNPNYIPTYQTLNSNIAILSFTSDDYYGLLDPGEGESTGYIDIGIGRLPVYDTTQASLILKKIENYISPESMGPWRNMICMVADDEDNNTHINDAESLSNTIASVAPFLNIEKVYLDSYNQETSINGDAYPEATKSINERIEAGCLIFNYLGHGSEIGLAHERVVKVEDINSWNNKSKLPVFITATCEFSRFDDIELDMGTGAISTKPSAGEMVLLNPHGGGIALLTTTRIVYSAPNYILNSRIYENAFELDENGKGLALGDILRLAKNSAGSGDNKRNFTLLGDPAIRLVYPWHGTIVTDSVNDVHITQLTDTIKALSEVRLKGHLEDRSGNRLSGINGIIYTSVYDKEYKVVTLANDGGNSYDYYNQDKILFKGKAEITDGNFQINMFIPRDIDYTTGYGKISYYVNSENNDFTGADTCLLIGGFNNLFTADTSGPVINLFMNDTLFKTGGLTDSDPVLLALLSDPGGINTAGTGIGHDIVTYLDDERAGSVVLNNYYENDLNTYVSGSIKYQLNNLGSGSHTINLKAWDNYNNSSSETLIFFVETGEEFILNKLLNYPNPVTYNTNINLEHSRPDTNMEIEILIFNTGGSLVKRILSVQTPSGYKLNPITWDGNDEGGNRVGKGIYIYSVVITTSHGEKTRISGRMVIL
ncbi:MAG: type IX secretion system sortase PorU, partial [Bacteroidales bacterium]|nr:type IX secretion system sortase PorU [Bacteroidales bacterium]